MATIEESQCYICKKVYCCIECCSNHIKRRHTGKECICPLCRGETLVIRKFHHKNFICHVVFNHLPLYCQNCGELFQNFEDLKNLSSCKRRPSIKIEPPSCVDIEASTLEGDTSSVVTKTPSNRSIEKKSFSWTADRSHLFTNSPPGLSRHTSTPMHVGLFKQKLGSVSKSPDVFLKTPKTPSSSSPSDSEKKKSKNQQSSNRTSESIYYDCSIKQSERTPLRSILSKSQKGKFFRSTERRLEAMQERDEQNIPYNLNSPEYSVNKTSQSSIESIRSRRDSKDSGKRVRFSDEFPIKPEFNEFEDINSNTIDITETDEFFEACQSFASLTLPMENLPSSIGDKFEAQDEDQAAGNDKHKVKQHTTDKRKAKQADKANKSTEPVEEAIEVKESMKVENNSESSRVVMMVLIEKSGDINANELINSSLKKLESMISNQTVNSSLLNGFQDVNKEKIEENGGFAMVSLDSYTRLSSVECFDASEGINIPQKNQQVSKQGNGIFAAVANAVKSAFKNLSSVATTKNSSMNVSNASNISNVSNTSITLNKSMNMVSNPSFLPTSPMRCSTLLVDPGESNASSLSNISESRTSKRRREENDTAVGLADRIGHGSLSPLSSVRSPLQKKAKGWYKQIRGRQPIARMKNNSFTCLKGISHETQCFQQGAFTVRDTILPLPARAYQVDQSTQTDS